MKHVLFPLLLIVAAPVFAQEAAPAPVGLTQDQVQLIRANLKGIYDVMGVPQQTDGKPAQVSAAQDQKTMADVADKALNLMAGLVTQVAGTLEKIAPKFWSIMVRQQYAKAVSDTIVPCSMSVIFLAIWVMLKKKVGWPDIEKKYWDDEDWAKFWLALTIPGIVCLLAFWRSVDALSDAAKYIINPEYYAVRDILLMFTRPGSM